MKNFRFLSLLLPLIAVAAPPDQNAVVITASNAAANQLLVYDTSGKLIQTIPTQGQGGAGGNSGGIAATGSTAAVVNFGSKTVSIFDLKNKGFQLKQSIPSVASPLSVAFGFRHLYILSTTKVESHPMNGPNVSSNPDGVVSLLKADGSSAQVGVVGNQLIISEKSNTIETVNLRSDGAVMGFPTLVQNIPANVDAPFGLITRGNNAYVTIAHADEISLVRNGAVLAVTPSVSQHAPCWLALEGPFLFSTNTSSHTISRYAVYGQKIVQDLAVAATVNGNPTDIDAQGGWLAAIDGNGPVSHVSIFAVDEDGNLSLRGSATMNSGANGIAILRGED